MNAPEPPPGAATGSVREPEAARRRRRGFPAVGSGTAIAFLLFVMLGLPEGILGAAWPSMRLDFGRPVASLAWLIVAYTLGYLCAAAGSGWLLEWFGVPRILAIGVAGSGLGVAGYATSVWWWLLVAAALVLGAGAATVDATLNTFVAITAGARAMNLLHAFFGVGATLGPLAVTAALRGDVSWRVVFGAVAIVELLLLIVVVARRDRFRITVRATDDEASAGGPMPIALLCLLLMFFAGYVGAEVSLGQWSYSLLVEERGVSTTLAGWAIAGYWGGLTLGRFLLAAAGNRLAPTRILRIAGVSTVVGVTVFWVDLVPGVDLAALAFVGLAQAGMFPAMVLLTPGWVGPHNTGRAVGLQLMASSIGAILASVVIGAAVRRWDLEAMPPIVVALTAATLLSFLAAARLAGRRGIAAPA